MLRCSTLHLSDFKSDAKQMQSPDDMDAIAHAVTFWQEEQFSPDASEYNDFEIFDAPGLLDVNARRV